jgi:hypothetical protein
MLDCNFDDCEVRDTEITITGRRNNFKDTQWSGGTCRLPRETVISGGRFENGHVAHMDGNINVNVEFENGTANANAGTTFANCRFGPGYVLSGEDLQMRESTILGSVTCSGEIIAGEIGGSASVQCKMTRMSGTVGFGCRITCDAATALVSVRLRDGALVELNGTACTSCSFGNANDERWTGQQAGRVRKSSCDIECNAARMIDCHFEDSYIEASRATSITKCVIHKSRISIIGSTPRVLESCEVKHSEVRVRYGKHYISNVVQRCRFEKCTLIGVAIANRTDADGCSGAVLISRETVSGLFGKRDVMNVGRARPLYFIASDAICDARRKNALCREIGAQDADLGAAIAESLRDVTRLAIQ